MNIWIIAAGLGAILGIGYGVLLLLASTWERVWKWIDDADKAKENKIMKFVSTKIFKYRRVDGATWKYYKDKECGKYEVTDGEIFIFLPMLVLCFLPTFCLLAFLLYPITIAAGILVLLAFLTRFSRRSYKRLSFHMRDKDAHKE